MIQPSAPQIGRLPNVSVKQLRAFVAAAELKSFSLAAHQEFQSQPAFSRSIQDMERELGGELFVRSPQGVILSKFGETLLPYAQKILSAYIDVRSGISEWRDEKSSKLTLAGCATVMHNLMPTLFEHTDKKISEVTLVLDAMSSNQVITKVMNGHTDVGICTVLQESNDLLIRPLLQSPLGLLMAVDYLIQEKIDELEDLGHLPFVRFLDDSIVTQLLLKHEINLQAYFNSKIITCGVPGVFPLIRTGKLIMIATGFGASHPLAVGLKFVPLPNLLPLIKIDLIINKKNNLSDKQNMVIDNLIEAIHSINWHASVQISR